MAIEVIQSDLTQFKCDAVINPANSYGYMGGGVAGALKRVGGIDIEREAVHKAPISVGSAVETTAGKLPCRFVIHAPTMKKPAMKIGADNVHKATFAAFTLAEKLKLNEIAIPGMGTGVGGVQPLDAAKAIIANAKKFESKFTTIFLVDRNTEMIEAFSKVLSEY